MRIAIDARMYGPERWTGIGRYLQNLLLELEQIDQSNEYFVLLGKDNFDQYQPDSSRFHKVLAPYQIYSFGEQFGLWLALRRIKPDLVHFPAPNAPMLWSGRRITTIHDLTLLSYNTSRHQGLKRLVSALKRWVFKLVMQTSVRRSTAILTPTRYVQEQLKNRYRLNPAQLAVTTLAMADHGRIKPQSTDRFDLAQQYLIYVGNCYPYKNVGLILEAMTRLESRRPNLQLVVVGRPDYFHGRLKARAAELGLSGRVLFTGAVSDGELASLYHKASLYAYPSLSEGFGLQCLEAMAQGVPVVAAEASCLPETCGEAALYFDPQNAGELADLIDRVLSDSQLRHDLVAAGKAHVATFSWHRTAEQTLAAYRKAGKA